jgi:hypothetical protein
MQLQRGAGYILFFSDGDEVTEMAQFHTPASIPIGYAQARNLVFPQSAPCMATWFHENNSESQ